MSTDDCRAAFVKATPSPAETLRRAAAVLRENASAAGLNDFGFAVADWLSMAADHAAGRGAACGSCVDQALTVARATKSDHDCANCADCLHDGHKCCGCYDGACCTVRGGAA